MRRILIYALGVTTLLLLAASASNSEQFTTSDPRAPEQRDILPIEKDLGVTAEADREPPEVSEPIELPDSIAMALAIVLGIGLLYLLSRQRFSFRFRRPELNITRSPVAITEEEEAEVIAEFARDLIDELNEGDSPRFAIQRAYAAVETGFGAKELARKPAETPLRYLDRIFGRHASVKTPLARLTDLFQQARFSDEPVDESMRGEAITALAEIRDYYTAIAWKKINNRRSKSQSNEVPA